MKYYVFAILLVGSVILYFIYSNISNVKEKVEIQANYANKKTVKQKVNMMKVDLTESDIQLNIPDTWHVHKEIGTLYENYFLTPYVFTDINKFIRGFYITTIHDVSKDKNSSPSLEAKKIVTNTQKIDPNLKILTSRRGHLVAYSFSFDELEKGPDQKRTSIYLFADDKLDIFITILFQYEKNNWSEGHAFHEAILKTINLKKLNYNFSN